MRPLNLIPQRISLQKHRRAQAVAAGFGLLVSLGLMAVEWTFLTGFNVYLTSSLNTEQAQLTTPRSTSPTTSKSTADAALRISQLNILSAAETNWDSTLTAASTFPDPSIKLTSLAISPTPTTATVTETGSITSITRFSSFVSDMQVNKAITGFSVTTYNYNSQTGLVTFTITYTLPASTTLYPKSS